MIWTDELVDELKRRKAGGETASQIAAAFGPDCTRNMIIGKINFLRERGRWDAAKIAPKRETDVLRQSVRDLLAKGVTIRQVVTELNSSRSTIDRVVAGLRATGDPAAPAPMSAKTRRAGVVSRARPAPGIEDRRACFVPPAGVHLVTLYELKAGCRWPFDHADGTLFCGAGLADPADSFCPRHAALAYARNWTSEERRLANEMYATRRRSRRAA